MLGRRVGADAKRKGERDRPILTVSRGLGVSERAYVGDWVYGQSTVNLRSEYAQLSHEWELVGAEVRVDGLTTSPSITHFPLISSLHHMLSPPARIWM